MRALILCAGIGSRLGNIAQGVPKPLIQINGFPCVEYQISKLKELGVKELMLNTHKNLDVFRSTINDSDNGTKVIFSDEESLLGTLGTLKKHLEWLSKGDFWVMHGDNIFTDDLSGMLDSLRNAPSDTIGVMGTFKTFQHKKVGIVKTDSEKRLIALYEKNRIRKGFMANAAIYLFRPGVKSVIHELPENSSDLTNDLLPSLLKKILVYPLKGRFIDIGTPRDLKRAKRIGKRFSLESVK